MQTVAASPEGVVPWAYARPVRRRARGAEPSGRVQSGSSPRRASRSSRTRRSSSVAAWVWKTVATATS
ncbi:MAG: hypothetical protein ACK559_03525, partial [bacterium]